MEQLYFEWWGDDPKDNPKVGDWWINPSTMNWWLYDGTKWCWVGRV